MRTLLYRVWAYGFPYILLALTLFFVDAQSQTHIDYTQIANVPPSSGTGGLVPTFDAGDGVIVIYNPSLNKYTFSVNPAVVGLLGSPNLWTGNNDFGMASHTTPTRVGPQGSVPSGCTVGELYFATDRSAGFNLLGCTAPGVWTPMR